MTTQTVAGKPKKEIVKLLTPEFRVSFPKVFKAAKVNEQDPNEKAKFSVQMLFQVKETAKSKAENRAVVDIRPIQDAVAKIFAEKLGADWKRIVTTTRKSDGAFKYRTPFHSGTETEKQGMEGYGEGIIFCSASSINKPGLVYPYAGPDGKPASLTEPNDFYGGCYARATINPYWYDKAGNTGVALGLQNLQKLRDGEPFAGRKKAEDEFDAIEPPTPLESADAGGPAGAKTTATGAEADPMASLL